MCKKFPSRTDAFSCSCCRCVMSRNIFAVSLCTNLTNIKLYITRIIVHQILKKPDAEPLCFRVDVVVAVGDGDEFVKLCLHRWWYIVAPHQVSGLPAGQSDL